MKNSSKFASLGIILFVFFLILSVLVSLNIFGQIDYSSTIAFQSFFPNYVITPFSIFSILGSAEIIGLILLIILLLFSKVRKIYILLFFAAVGVIELLGKTIIVHYGPPIELLKTNISLGLPSNTIPHEFFSYPSGHASRTAFVSAVLIFALWKSHLRKELKISFAILVLSFDILMFVSRIYLGEHWLTDVVGGALLGFSLAFFISYFLKPKPAK